MRAATTLLAALPALALAAPQKRAPLITPRDTKLIPGKYVVKFKPTAEASVMDSTIASIAANADHKYPRFGGFSASLTDAEIEILRDDPSVAYVEQDAEMHMTATQEGAPWGLARLSNTAAGSSTYTYDDSAGSGTCAYVLDTGIDVDHSEFEGRASFLANFADSNDGDGQGHGTHVAGTIGSATYGVAKKTSLFAVKVLNDSGSGTNAGVIAGMEFVVEDASSQDCPSGVVVNMSLGGGFSSAINDAAAAIVSAGHFLAVAAGNEASDASNSSPASEASACTVGATDESDSLASYSNYGSIVDILAPGSDVLSTVPGGSTDSLSGTSMASPHVAGLGAYFLGTGEASASDLCSYIASVAQEGAISGVPSDTVNLITQNGA